MLEEKQPKRCSNERDIASTIATTAAAPTTATLNSTTPSDFRWHPNALIRDHRQQSSSTSLPKSIRDP